MPRFFLNLEGITTVTDHQGEVFNSVDDAERHAQRIAWELSKNSKMGAIAGNQIVMTDHRRRPLARIPLLGASDPEA